MAAQSTIDSTFNTVSMYVGFITGIAGIILSIIAMIFAVSVQKDASRVSEQMIKTLAKVETATDRVTQDTANLIKAAWDKMLDSGKPDVTLSLDATDRAVDAVRTGLVAEATNKINETRQENGSSNDKIKELLDSMSAELEEKIQQISTPTTPSQTFESIVVLLQKAPPSIIELLRWIADNGHLTAKEYGSLLNEPLYSDNLAVLRKFGIIIPLRDHKDEYSDDSDDLDKDPVYWFQPNKVDSIRAAMMMFPPNTKGRDIATQALRKSGYLDRTNDETKDKKINSVEPNEPNKT